VHFDIRMQKVVWILTCREWVEEAAGNALREVYTIPDSPTISPIFFI
jgi:hypothetical protein